MDLLAAYLPTDRLHALADGATLPSRARGTALFADISGFTPLTEALVRTLGPRRGAEELARQLNEIYDALIAEVDRYGGSVISFSGDAITCWFEDVGDGGWGMGDREGALTPKPQTPNPPPAKGGGL
jgi:adenylate cyclase